MLETRLRGPEGILQEDDGRTAARAARKRHNHQRAPANLMTLHAHAQGQKGGTADWAVVSVWHGTAAPNSYTPGTNCIF